MKEKIVVGDIHGSLKLLDKVLNYVKDYNPEDVIFLGDYVDRGKESKQVLEKLMQTNYLCLMGNHDNMLLDFVDNGDMLSVYNDWDMATIRSYFPNMENVFYDGGHNIYAIESNGITSRMNDIIRYKLKDEPTIEWLRKRFYIFEDKENIYVHAGLDLSLLEPRKTSNDEMIWHRPNYELENNTGKNIVVGHTIVDEIHKTKNGIIMCDCGNSFKDTAFVWSTTRGVIRCD